MGGVEVDVEIIGIKAVLRSPGLAYWKNLLNFPLISSWWEKNDLCAVKQMDHLTDGFSRVLLKFEKPFGPGWWVGGLVAGESGIKCNFRLSLS